MPTNTTPLTLRLAGLWLIWSAWCSASGWLLSAVHQLHGFGYAALLPFLAGCAWWWLKATAPERRSACDPVKKLCRRFRRPAAFVYLLIVALSLLAGLLYTPWSFDAASYRLPRLLYWWAAHHWYWIDTLDHRLDYSSTGFEWQMLPVIIFTHSDRGLFFLNWVPFLLLPGLVFLAFQKLGVTGRSARRWAWLFPSAYCIALQCSGIQNDGYTTDYLLVAAVLAVVGCETRRLGLVLMSVLAAALLTGAKVSDLPLLLPLAALLLPALGSIRWFNWKVPAVLLLAVLCSGAPMALLCWKYTGDWAGDPGDQWMIKARHPAGAIAANLALLANDGAQLPYFPGNQAINQRLEPFNDGKFSDWLRQSHGQYRMVHFGQMVYEGGAGPGFGLAAYAAILVLGALLVHRKKNVVLSILPWSIRLAPWLGGIAYVVFLAKLGSDSSPRIGVPYYPLLIIALLRFPRVAVFERTRAAGVMAVALAATVIPIILITPARPLVPVERIARRIGRPGLVKIADQYRFWSVLQDDLAPLRAQFPAEATRVGYAGAFRDTSYGLWKPFGHRVIVELGLPPGRKTPPPPDLKYAVVTEHGIEQRYGENFTNWLAAEDGKILFTLSRNAELESHKKPKLESWYLVTLNPSISNRLDTPPATMP